MRMLGGHLELGGLREGDRLFQLMRRLARLLRPRERRHGNRQKAREEIPSLHLAPPEMNVSLHQSAALIDHLLPSVTAAVAL